MGTADDTRSQPRTASARTSETRSGVAVHQHTRLPVDHGLRSAKVVDAVVNRVDPYGTLRKPGTSSASRRRSDQQRTFKSPGDL